MNLFYNYINKGQNQVEGWLDEIAIITTKIINDYQINKSIQGYLGEIGIHHGKFFILLYNLLRENEKGVAIDLYDNQNDNIDHSGKGNLKIFKSNISKHTKGDKSLEIVKSDSIKLTGKIIFDKFNNTFRIFSVDGGHTREVTAHDLKTANDILTQKGGVVILDDYFNEWWPGVSEGTNAFFYNEKHNLVPFAIGGNKIFFTNDKEMADKYKEVILKENIGKIIRFSELFGYEIICISKSDAGIKERMEKSIFAQKIKNTYFGKKLRKIAMR